VKLPAAAAAAFVIATIVPVYAVDGIEPGLWKVTTTVVDRGMKVPPRVTTRCLTPQQAGDLSQAFSPQFGGMNTVCERTDYRKAEQQMSWRLQCKGQMDMDVVAEFVFPDATHYTGTISTRGWMAGQQIADAQVALEGEHVGPCGAQ
jgi:hypothetical protein